MSQYAFSLPIGSMDQIHAVQKNADGTAITACGMARQLANRNPIMLDLIETTCQKCLDAMGWQVGVIPDFYGPGQDLPIKGPPELFEKHGGKRA